MKNKAIFLLWLLFPVWGFSQQILDYQGPYPNGTNEPGEAIYKYYFGSSREKVKHGNFRYSVKSKEGDYKFYQTFAGAYKDNLKNGKWTYSLNYRDYFRNKDGEFFTGRVDLSASYVDGIPDGTWKYVDIQRKRKQIAVQGKTDWERFSADRTIEMLVNFSNGVLVDSFKVSYSDGYSLEGIFNKSGYVDGTWIYRKGNVEERTEYSNGVKKSLKKIDIQSNKEISNEVFTDNIKRWDQYSLAKDKTKLQFTVNTLSLLNNPQDLITESIISNLFNDQYFVLTYIDGDKGISLTNGTRALKIVGAFYYQFENEMTADEARGMNTVSKLKDDIIAIKDNATMFTRTIQMNPAKSTYLKVLENNALVAQTHACYINNILNNLEIAEGSRQAIKNCASKYNTTVQLPDFKTKNEAINHSINELSRLKKDSESKFELIKK